MLDPMERTLRAINAVSVTVPPLTTRAPMMGEKQGREYLFISPAGFLTLKDQGKLTVWQRLRGDYYGLVDDAHAEDAFRYAQLIDVDAICRARVAQPEKHSKLSFVRGFARGSSSIKRLSRSVRRMGSRFKRGTSGDKTSKGVDAASTVSCARSSNGDSAVSSDVASSSVGDGGCSARKSTKNSRLGFFSTSGSSTGSHNEPGTSSFA
eukprot:m.233428 g.233428  ORF g.233428 m.233428 type:complete len:208 (+) comp19294_c0_seq8:350-973(+)